jgi:hypothetical protein
MVCESARETEGDVSAAIVMRGESGRNDSCERVAVINPRGISSSAQVGFSATWEYQEINSNPEKGCAGLDFNLKLVTQRGGFWF